MWVVTLVYTVVFMAVGIALLVRSSTTGQQASQRLGLWMLAIALIAAGVSIDGDGTSANRLATDVQLFGFGVYPLLLLHFGGSLRTDTRRLERMAVVVLALEAIGSAIILSGIADRAVALDVLFGYFALFAVLAHVLVQSVLVTQIRQMASSFVRGRAVVLSTGMLVLAASLAVGALFPGDVSTVLGLVGGGIAAALLVAGAAPPRWLLSAFLQPDHDNLVAAEEALTTEPDVVAAVEGLLEALLRLYSGRAAWLRHDGVLLAAVGGAPEDYSTPRPKAEPDDALAQVVDEAGESLWLLHGERAGCELAIVAGRDAVLYGLDVADLLPRTARRVAVALEGRELEARRRAQHEAEQDAAHYRQVAELKDDLLSTINHELRTTLQTVAGGLELVTARWDGLQEEQRRLLVERADQNARDLSAVVAEILSLAELRAGVTRVVPRATTLREVTDRALAALDDGRVEVVCPNAEVVVDTELVARVLRQLTDNALEHTEGPVRVEVDVVDDEVRLLVHDRGPGVDEELLAPFERGGHYLHRTTRGFGLGLTLVVETLQLLDGQLHFSHDDQGTTAACRVPHAGATRSTTGSVSPSPGMAGD